jgi:predicted transcriptional regulator of viral defense system
MHIEEVTRLLSVKKFPVFSFEELSAFYPDQKTGTLKKYLFRWKKRGWIAGLRRGLYELTFPIDLKIPDLYLANRIYAPSYISLETALSHYAIIPEVAMAVVSVTSRTTRRFKNHHGLFVYRSIQPKAFCGYHLENHSGYDVFMADPEKAVVDYVYFQTLRGQKFDADEHRLDRKRIRKLKMNKMKLYAGLYGVDLKEACLC